MKILIGAVVILLFITSATYYVSDLTNQYNATANISGFAKTQERLNTTSNIYSDTFNEQKEGTMKEDDISTTYAVVKMAVKSVRLVWNSFLLVATDIPRDINNILLDQGFLPEGMEWILYGVEAIIIASIIIFMIGFFMRYKVG